MAKALAAAHGLTHHPSLLPLYAVFRDVGAAAGSAAGAAGAGAGWHPLRAGSDSGVAGNGGLVLTDKVVMVYPGGSAQHPLDAGSACPPSPSEMSPFCATAPGGGGAGMGPPVSERGVIRGVLQPLSDLLAVLGSLGLRPPYLCGLDVWMDSPEAPGPGQALFMVPLLCHRWAHSPPLELPPAASPYTAPYLREHPVAAVDQVDSDEQEVKRWLSWSAAALVHAVLIGSPPPDKPAPRKSRVLSDAATGGGAVNGGSAGAGAGGGVPQLPPLSTHNSGSTPRTSMVAVTGAHRPSVIGLQQALAGCTGRISISGAGVSGGGNANGGGGANGDASGGGCAGSGGAPYSRRNSAALGNSSRRSSRAADSMPLWLSDEAGDWFRRGLALDCGSRACLDEQLRHPWVARHALPRSVTAGATTRRESLGHMPRELHPLILDLVPMGLTRPGRQEVDSLMSALALSEGPSAAKPALPWQVVEGPQQAPPGLAMVVVDEFTEDGDRDGQQQQQHVDGDGEPSAPKLLSALVSDTPLVERIEVAEREKDDGTRVVEEVRVLSDKPGGALSRAAKALQAAMVRRAEAAQWVMANPRGATFDDIARQNQQRSQPVPPLQGAQRRASSGGAPASPSRGPARTRSPETKPARAATPTAPAPAAAAATARVSIVATGTAARGNKSPTHKVSRTSVAKNGKVAK